LAPSDRQGGDTPNVSSSGIPDISKIPIATKGDAAAALLGYVGGYVADIALLHLGIPPGTGGILGAAAGVGFKNWIHSVVNTVRSASARRRQLEKKALAFEDFLRDLKGKEGERERFERDLNFWRKGLIRDEQFEKAIDEAIARYRRRLSPDELVE
jgi:hypothetical protein